MSRELVAEYDCGSTYSLPLPRDQFPFNEPRTKAERHRMDELVHLLDMRHRRICLECPVESL